MSITQWSRLDRDRNHCGALRVTGIAVCLMAGACIAGAQTEARTNRAQALLRLNNELLGVQARMQEAAPESLETLRREGGAILRARASGLSALIQEDPTRALSLAFPPELLQNLAATFSEDSSSLESHGTWQGPIQISVLDYPDGKSSAIHWMKVGETTLELHFPGREAAGLKTGDVVSVTGFRLGLELVPSETTRQPASTEEAMASAEATSTSTSQPCSTTGAQNTAVLLGAPAGVTPPVTPQAVQDVFFGTASGHSLDGYWREASYGQTSATGNVFGWYPLPGTYSCSTVSQMFSDTMSAATAAGVNLALYSRIFFVFPDFSPSCVWAGWSQVGGCSMSSPVGTLAASWSYIVANNLSTRDLGVNVVAHEGGHQLGLNHGSTLSYGTQPLGPLGSAGTLSEYGDWWTVMGTTELGLYSAPHRAMLGWMTSGQSYQTVQSNGSYTLQPIEVSPPALQALKVQRGTGNPYWLWLEYRQPLGNYDPTEPNAFAEVYSGALVHYEDSTTAPHTQLIGFTPGDTNFYSPALAAGQTWVDPYSNLSIAVQSATSSGLTLTVNYGAASCTLANPAVTMSPANPSVTAGSSVNYTVSATNNDSSGCSASTFTLTSKQPSGWSAAFSPASLSISPGQTVSATLTVTVPVSTASGTYAVTSSAANGSYVGSGAANATVATALTLTDSTSVPSSTYTGGKTVPITALVQSGGTPAAGASVTFTLTKSNGNKVTGSATTDGTGKASWSYKLSPKDPSGSYLVINNASYQSQTVTSNSVTFTVK